MTDSKINLMALVPKPDVPVTVHTVGMPSDLRDGLFKVLPPRREGDNLFTKHLNPELHSWLDQAVAVKGIRRAGDCPDWLVALESIDLGRLSNIIANWLACTCADDVKGTADYKRVMDMLAPECFAGMTAERQVCLFDARERPSKDSEGLAFSAFSVQVAAAIVGHRFDLPGGASLAFSRISRGTKKEYELMSNVLWHDGDPYAVVLSFHVETLPVGRKARLNVDVMVRRFISGIWAELPNVYMGTNVNALVRTDNGTYRPVPYGYSKACRGIGWSRLAQANYECMGLRRLPAIEDYLANIGSFAAEGCDPQILSPHSPSTAWAKASSVKSGVSVVDKAAIFGEVAKLLSRFAVPEEPLASVNRINLKTAFDDPKETLWDEQPELAKGGHDAWARSNRRRLAAATGERKIAFEIVGTTADADVAKLVRNEIVYFLGAEGDADGLCVEVSETCQDRLLAPLNKTGEEGTKLRWRMVESSLGEASGLTACIVLLPDADSDAFAATKKRDSETAHEDASQADQAEKGKGPRDPKTALRMGFARSGRLTQFLVPTDDGSLAHRARAAVRDLMRQLGFIPELKAVRNGSVFSIPVFGLRVYDSPQGKARAQIPLAVRMEAGAGLVTVDCPLFESGRMRYWRALLELARISTSRDYQERLSGIAGRSLKRMLDCMKAEATGETLLLVRSYGSIRTADWWPGISDGSLAQGVLRYGPTRISGARVEDEPFEVGESGLNVLRVRSGADKEVPDYFTDVKSESGEKNGGLPVHRHKQGIFPRDGFVLALSERPKDKSYASSVKGSKFVHPNWLFAEKTLNEYCLLTSDDAEKAVELAKYAEALRGSMVQLVKSDMEVNLPAPLHLAEKMEEYIWAPERHAGRRPAGRAS